MSTSWRRPPPTWTTSCGWRTATAASDARHEAWIGLGTNLGDRRANLAAALREIARLGEIRAISSVYESDAVGYTAQPVFWNLVLHLRTGLSPDRLLYELNDAEQRLGRRPTFRYGPRIIDLDLLLFDALRVSSPGLEVPHPRMLERAFVLRPLAELDHELRHPVTGERLADHLEQASTGRAVPLFPGAQLLSGTEADPS